MPLTDTHDRSIRYLRLSLTPACQMRCVYCRPQWLKNHTRGNELSPAELERLVRHLVARHGLYKVRLTGGDPTARPDLIEIIERLAGINGIRDLAMTTNGLSLASRANDYARAGVRRLNVSLDSLHAETFERMTGVDGLQRVLDGLDAAEAAGLSPIKLNTVVLRDVNEAELPELVRFASERGMPIRFIELMPMGPLADHWAERYVPEARMRQTLEPHVCDWRSLAQGSDSARRYEVSLIEGRRADVGFITPMSCNFCSACNRIRITSRGAYYPCLMDRPAESLMPALRPRFDGDMLDALLASGLRHKREEHPQEGFVTMTTIGG